MRHKTSIYGLGTAVPRYRGSRAASMAFMGRLHQNDPRALTFIRKIYGSSGIEMRHSVIPDFLQKKPENFVFFPKNWNLEPFPTTQERMKVYREESVNLSTTASKRAMNAAGVLPREITHLLISTCTGFFAPGPDILLIKSLGLHPTVHRTLIGFMGCYAGFNGMRAADQIVRADPKAVVLQICVELCSIHFQKDPSPEFLVSNSLFADGCSAAVYMNGSRASAPVASVLATFSMVDGNSLDDMQWHIGNHGFRMKLSVSVPETLRTRAPSFVRSLLSRGGISREEVRGWAVHPGGKKIIEGIQNALSLRNDQVSSAYDILKRYGNMSSPTIFFVLQKELQKEKGPVVCLGFGPGLTIEGALLSSA